MIDEFVIYVTSFQGSFNIQRLLRQGMAFRVAEDHGETGKRSSEREVRSIWYQILAKQNRGKLGVELEWPVDAHLQ